jgi:uncharacterized protein YceK
MIRSLLMGCLILVVGCAAIAARTQGVEGPVSWRATDFKVVKTPAGSERSGGYSFVLILKEMTGVGIVFTSLQHTVSQHGIQPSSAEATGRWVLPAHGELRLPFAFSWHCPEVFEACGPVLGAPHWTIVLAGTAGRGKPVRLVIDLIIPPTSIT